MEQSIIQDYFSEILGAADNRPVIEAKKAGKIPIGYTCSYVPDVLLSVDRLMPIRMRAPGITGTEMADTYLSSVLCTYTRSLLEYAMNDKYDFLDGWVFASSCDHMCRLLDNVNYLLKPSFSHVMDVPRVRTEESLKWYTEELHILIEKLSSQFDVDMNNEAISETVKRHNEIVKLVATIADLRKEDNPLITGTEFHRLMISYLCSPKDMIVEPIKNFRADIKKRNGIGDYRARLMIVGSELDDPRYTEVIESMGGLVVADRYCTGSLPELQPIPETGDPISSIAEHVFTTNLCARMLSQFERRISYIFDMVKEYKVDGIVIETIKFCDLWSVEATVLTSELREAGVPVLRLERDYHQAAEGQLRTRIQAFIESMGK